MNGLQSEKEMTVVIACRNEADNLPLLLDEIEAALEGRDHEVIIVDDGSTDGTAEKLGPRVADSGGRLRMLRHDRSAGQSAAVRSGVFAANGRVVVTLDGDGQNDPHDLPAMIGRIAPAGDNSRLALIGGVRQKRKDTGSKRWASKAANRIRDWVLHDDCPDTGCGIKVFWREVFLKLPFFTSIHRYLPALFQTYGYRCEYVPVNSRERVAGVSKYNNFNRALIGLYDLVGVSWLRRRTRHPQIREDG